MDKTKNQSWNHEERRRYMRIEKHFIISYYDKNDPAVKHNISQLKNISMGGMCFVSPQTYSTGTQMGIELKTPYVADMVHLESIVLQAHEKIPNMIYEVRVRFEDLSSVAQLVLNKIVDTFSKISKEKNP